MARPRDSAHAKPARSILTFCAVAAFAKFPWAALSCRVEGVVNRITRFVEVDISAQLTVPAATDAEHAEHLLLNAKHACLASHSLNATVRLEAAIVPEVACTA